MSKRFRKLIRQPAVWCDLDLSSHASFLTDRIMLNVVRDDGAFSLLRSVCLSGCARVTDAAVCRLLSICGATLQHLDLQGCTLIKTSTVLHAARTCPNLTYLDLFGCTGVDTLEAGPGPGPSPYTAPSLSQLNWQPLVCLPRNRNHPSYPPSVAFLKVPSSPTFSSQLRRRCAAVSYSCNHTQVIPPS